MKRIIYALLVTLSLLMQAPTTAQNQTVSGATEKVLIRTRKPYNNVVAKIESLGGRVKHQYKYIDAIAAEVPRGSLEKQLVALPNQRP
jgi:hypothetical protein